MTKVLILYYSAYGQMERMAQAIAEGEGTRASKLTSSECRNWSGRDGKQSGFKLK
jgi:flavodoxin